MKKYKFLFYSVSIVIVVLISLLVYDKVFAHCDTLGGPVVKACKDALDKENVNLVLIWVKPEYDSIIKASFNRTLTVRKLSPEAKELADMNFFETVVRIHRTGEGAGYTGLKPADTDLGPAIPAGDNAIIEGNTNAVQKLLNETIQNNLSKHFIEVMEKKNYDQNDVVAGREYVKSYVEYIHYVERLYETAKNPVEGHFHELGEN